MTDLAIVDHAPPLCSGQADTVACFTPGTRIATPKGERLVETLTIGDRILTRDNGIQSITWAGFRPIPTDAMKDKKTLRPVLIRAGSLGRDMPERDMLVSPQHRMLVVSDLAKAHFNEKEVLVAAKDLTMLDGVDVVNVPGTTYLHFMFDAHQVVLSDGTWSESFQPNDFSLKGVAAEQRSELLNIYPNLATNDGLKGYTTARKALKRIESYLLFK
ncbi:Hint domain-containing protein [Yoonia sediminilitoris]|uniref:Hint domain-containing protein n=1 Tax=Yoonia sediminilitoris TaxID=1286148 RepID=A0A2T6KCW9_9RHOB|nr:Hint domain-containing protein [Yoonia sediminilitoris]PUB12809.1 Hint domain-containing protein [Yoonia sediminilitoris]RCW94288.1 Hint domain-containing protein [Yoonia sediminilitoris]